MADMLEGVIYGVEPQVVTEVEAMLAKQVQYMSMSMSRMPVDRRLTPYQKNYEHNKTNHETGIGFEMSVSNDTGVTEEMQKFRDTIPAVYFNKAMDFDEYREQQESVWSLNERLSAHLEQMALRIDIYNYQGSTKHSIDNLMTANPGTELSTALDVSTTALASTTTAAFCSQLKSQMKYSGIINNSPNIIVECTPSLFEELSVRSTNEDFNAYDSMLSELNRQFPGGNHQIVENFLLDATISIPDDTKKHDITISTADKALIYIQDPRIMKILQSPLEIRQSPVISTEGYHVQPVIRNRRWDNRNDTDDTAVGVLIETAATVS